MSFSGSTRFHLTAQPWTAASVTSAQLLSRISGELAYFSRFQSGNGAFPDPVNGMISGRVQANFAYSAAVLAQAGDRTYMAQAIKAMNYSTADYAAGAIGQNGGKDGPEFELPSLVKAYMIFRDNGLVSAGQLAQWAGQLSTFHYTPGQADGNWSTYAMDGAWLQFKAGLVSHAAAVGEIESLWTKFQSARENSGTDGLYVDATPTPDSLSVEAVGRGNFTDIVANGYDGPSAGVMAAVIQQGGARTLLMEDPIGQVPAGGRTDNHLFVDAGYEAIDQMLAKMNANSNPSWRRSMSRRQT